MSKEILNSIKSKKDGVLRGITLHYDSTPSITRIHT